MKRKVIALATLGMVVTGLSGLTAAPASAQGCYNNSYNSNNNSRWGYNNNNNNNNSRWDRQARRAYQRQLRQQNRFYANQFSNQNYSNGCSPYNNNNNGVVGRVLNWVF